MNNFSKYSDETLTGAVKSGNIAAFKALYYRYYESLHAFIWLRTHSTELAQDFIQEVFTRLWQNRENLNPENSVKAYLYQIANNLVIDHYRKKKSEHSFLAHRLQEKSSNSDNSLESAIEIKMAIENLPENCRVVFVLSRYQGLTYLEIADALNISAKTVEARMSKALKILRDDLL